MKVIVHGSFDRGQHTGQRAEALNRVTAVEVIPSAVRAGAGGGMSRLARSVAWRLRIPLDEAGENQQLLELVRQQRPDVVYVENSRLLRARTLRTIVRETGAKLVYFSPDDIVAGHNSSRWLESTYDLWDLFYTTKSFLVGELAQRGVRRPILINNFYTPSLHRPMTQDEVGPEFEQFDLVFVGTFEREREESLRKLADAGFKVLVHGSPAGLLAGGWDRLSRAGVTVRPPVMDIDYTRAIHHGKVALAFLRKINRDLITQRSVELPAMGRAMLAERTAEHDAHFVEGREYLGFSTDPEMIEQARRLLQDEHLRTSIAAAGRVRCIDSGYDVDTLMVRIANDMRELLGSRQKAEIQSL